MQHTHVACQREERDHQLHSEYELKEQSVAKEMSNASPKIIAELEEYHKATLMALASVHGGCGMPLTVAIAGLDARGLMLRVSESDGGDERDGTVSTPFGRCGGRTWLGWRCTVPIRNA